MKKILSLLLLTVTLTSTYAQEVDVDTKKEEITVDGKLFVKYKRVNAIQISFYTLAGDEFLFYNYDNNGTINYNGDDIMTMNFLTAKVKVTTDDFSRIAAMTTKKMVQKMIKWLIEEKVLSADGSLNTEKVQLFYEKYNQEIGAKRR
jgi:hypothetical protein